MLVLSKDRERRAQWQRAAELLLAQADVADFSKQVELALFHDAKLDVSKVPCEMKPGTSSRPHDRLRQLAETAEVLGTLVRNILLKRALHTADPNPRLNFWRIQYGNLMDMAVIDWCKLFGSDDAERQPIHWKNITDDQDSFRSALLSELAMTHEDWETYWQEMKRYRDFNAAHHNPRRAEIAVYPVLDKALSSVFFYFEYIRQEMQELGEDLQPANIRTYATDFEAKCLEVARIALASTKDIPEAVEPMRPG